MVSDSHNPRLETVQVADSLDFQLGMLMEVSDVSLDPNEC